MEIGDVKRMRELEKENAKLKDESEIIEELNILIEKHPRNGFWLLFNRLRKKGFA